MLTDAHTDLPARLARMRPALRLFVNVRAAERVLVRLEAVTASDRER